MKRYPLLFCAAALAALLAGCGFAAGQPAASPAPTPAPTPAATPVATPAPHACTGRNPGPGGRNARPRADAGCGGGRQPGRLFDAGADRPV